MVRDHLAHPSEVVPKQIRSRIAQQMFAMLIAAGAAFAEPSSLPVVFADQFSLEFALPNGVRVLYTECDVSASTIYSLTRYGVVLTSSRCFAQVGGGAITDTLQMFAGASRHEESGHDASGFEYLKVLATALRDA
ncbi:MAG TPA: hypothetical protein VHE81_19835 [Lacipirellulaceae bacterium]|nr:hypothetical protein [Lacipirellulaceae bacterium]